MDRDNNVERWVEKRLAALQPPPDWQPDGGRAFARLSDVGGAIERRRVRRLVIVGAFAAACVAAMLFEAPKAYCAGGACGNTPGESKPISNPTRPAPQPGKTTSFKIAGAATAPVTCEIYSDYECPACAAAYRDVVPVLRAEYVATGKVRLIHRDFPLAMHRYSRVAARYANAAGRVGEYDFAVAQLFRTQAAWSQTGDIDAQLASVLSPIEMEKVRQLVNGDATLDESTVADIAMGREDEITSTPTMIVVKDGKREKISPMPSYELLKSYLDRMIK
jgi:protein-disulfide isomerase